MDQLIQYVVTHSEGAQITIFIAILLAGLNIPISIDLLLIATAFLAASILPEKALSLYITFFIGCCLSAWLAYGVGRVLGKYLLKYGWFAKIFSGQRLEKIYVFYRKYGFLTLLVGRFIPFGMRSCIFMTTGMSRSPFWKFALRDFFACLIWSGTTFSLFYFLGKNLDVLKSYGKTFNLCFLAALGIAVITFIWYKKRKQSSVE